MMEHFMSTGEEVGASLVIDIAGKTVVDLWGGSRAPSQAQKWEKDTIVNVFSVTKTVTSLAALLLIDRGIIDPYEKVSTYWPEFAANGKENVEIRHIISHTSGVPGWEKTVTLAEICDFDLATSLLAAQHPWWEPGTASGYHSFTHGMLIGQVIRRVTGTTLKEFVAKELAQPLCADFQIGLVDADLDRVSDVIPFAPEPASTTPVDRSTIPGKVNGNPAFTPDMANTPLWRHAELGGGNGHGNARGLAKMLSIISLGGKVEGKRYLRPTTIDLIFKEQANGTDLVTAMPLRFGTGYGIRGEGVEPFWLPQGRICFWGGLGGSLVVMDLDRKMTIAYAMNKMYPVGLGSNVTKSYVGEIYKALGSGDGHGQ
jgi:CubicO group peptidase (beta-lactamase class C family)